MVERLKAAAEFLPWAAVGFVLGAVAGFQWGKTAKSRIGESITTDYEGGVLSVKVDTYQAARAGLSDSINQFISGIE